jgi:hypothetical protein
VYIVLKPLLVRYCSSSPTRRFAENFNDGNQTKFVSETIAAKRLVGERAVAFV